MNADKSKENQEDIIQNRLTLFAFFLVTLICVWIFANWTRKKNKKRRFK